MPNKRILVIEDDPCVREIVCICLCELGKFDAIEAGSGREGLDKAFQEHPDAIVLDLSMPQMDGMEVLRQLQAYRPTQTIPVIILSALASRLNREWLSTQGVVETILKPFDCLTLPGQIAAACQWKSEPS
jgi:CheY-like chemotaxis protein